MDIEKQELINQWQKVFLEVNEKPAPHMYYMSGWFRIDEYRSKYRKAQLEQMINTLSSRLLLSKSTIEPKGII
jgi:hypothetical protein